jgi:hypothetical protein
VDVYSTLTTRGRLNLEHPDFGSGHGAAHPGDHQAWARQYVSMSNGAWHSRAGRIANGIYVDDETWAQLSAIAERHRIRRDG